jgi:hypothetical protein
LHNKTDGGEGVAGFDFSNERNNFYGKKHSEATKRKYFAARAGAGNAHYGKKHSVRARGMIAARHAKYLYQLIDPAGEVHMTESLRDFCGQYGLDRRSLTKLLAGEKNFYRGWKNLRGGNPPMTELSCSQFAKHALGVELWPKQREILDKFVREKYQSCHLGAR